MTYSDFHKFILFVFCLLTPLPRLLAQQNDCPLRLANVIKEYNEGTIDNVVSENVLQECLSKNKFTKEEEIEALKYLTLIYLYVNDNTNARKNMVEFMKARLKSNPEYDPRNTQAQPESGVPEFLEMYNNLKALPIYYVGLRAGASFAQVETTTNFSLDQSNITRGNYKPLLGYDVALSLEFPIGRAKRPFSLVSELVYQQKAYEYSDQILDFAGLTFTELQNQIAVPLLLKYHFKRHGYRKNDKNNETEIVNNTAQPVKERFKNKVQPFLVVGASASYLLYAQADLNRVDVLNDVAGGGSREPINGSYDLLAFSQREQLQIHLILGGGFRFRNFLKSGSDLLLEGRFNWGLTQQVIAVNRGANDDFIYKFGYIDSDFKLHNLSINISYIIPKYNPDKKKKGK